MITRGTRCCSSDLPIDHRRPADAGALLFQKCRRVSGRLGENTKRHYFFIYNPAVSFLFTASANLAMHSLSLASRSCLLIHFTSVRRRMVAKTNGCPARGDHQFALCLVGPGLVPSEPLLELLGLNLYGGSSPKRCVKPCLTQHNYERNASQIYMSWLMYPILM